MLRVEREDRTRTTYSDHFVIVVVYDGAMDGWYRGGVRTHVPSCTDISAGLWG